MCVDCDNIYVICTNMKRVYYSPCIKYAEVCYAGKICQSSDFYGYTPTGDPIEAYDIKDGLNDDAFM